MVMMGWNEQKKKKNDKTDNATLSDKSDVSARRET